MADQFLRFRSLPGELQSMVFDEVIRATKNPRIVLLDMDQRQIFNWDSHLYSWQLKVSNWGQLHEENPAPVARKLLGVCSVSTRVATQSLEHPDVVSDPAEHIEPLRDLGVSLSGDVFWLPDDLARFVRVRRGPPARWSPSFDEEKIESIAISADTFEIVVHLEKLLWADNTVNDETAMTWSIVLPSLFYAFASLRKLVTMVDVPREHVSWDQLQIFRGKDPFPIEMSDDNGRARYRSVAQSYDAIKLDVLDLGQDEIDEALDPEGNPISRTPTGFDLSLIPELYFAFLKP